ncbi:MAG: hypothetical protein BYD32DRAFT_403994 [Podila humilis]|nr:MAG: hypothetical protein BYD32DRAFT_403994 [Podila humilis]
MWRCGTLVIVVLVFLFRSRLLRLISLSLSLFLSLFWRQTSPFCPRLQRHAPFFESHALIPLHLTSPHAFGRRVTDLRISSCVCVCVHGFFFWILSWGSLF